MPPSTPNADTQLEAIAGGDVAAALAAAEPAIKVLDRRDDDLFDPLVVARRQDHVVDTLDLEGFAETPGRQRGVVTALTADGFITTFEARTLGRGEDSPEAAIYADIDQVELVAVLNDDYANTAGWRDHRITYKPTLTPEWKLWVAGQDLGPQSRFAETIEAGEREIVHPSATEMLDLAQTFHASTSAKFKMHGRLRDGRTQVTYEEEVDATAGVDGEAKIPAEFTLKMRPFYGAEPVEVRARIRFRLLRGALEIGYFLDRPDEVLRSSFVADVVDHVAAELPKAPMLHARPAGPTTALR